MTSLHGGARAAGSAEAAAAGSGFARTSAVLGVPPIASAPPPTLLDRFEPPEPRDDPFGRRDQGRRPRPR